MTAGDSFFLDTNILLYRLSINEPAKQRAAQDWISALWAAEQAESTRFVDSVSQPSPRVARSSSGRSWNPAQPTLTQVQRAWHWCDAAHINFWDALIVAAAEQSGCLWLVSEDFQAGQRFGAVTVLNPFQRAPAEFGLSVR